MISGQNNQLLANLTQHTHPQRPSKVQSEKTIHVIRERAEGSDEPTSSEIQNWVINYPLAAVGALLKKRNVDTVGTAQTFCSRWR